jgi:hypothetical protein
MTQYRQGDVFLERIGDTLPESAVHLLKEETDIILAYGEETGHAHRIQGGYAKMYRWEGDTLIETAPEGARLTHEEHGTIDIKPGIYRVRRQREFDPYSEATQWVND